MALSGKGNKGGWGKQAAAFLSVLLVGPWASLPVPLCAQTPTVLLDTLRVQVGSRASPGLPVLTRSVRLFDQDEIRALPVRTLSDLLKWATGVDVQARSPAQSDLGIRGASFEQVVVLVNGVRVSDPQTGHFDLDLTVPLDQVERVEVLRGPASALYGADAVGGVVNLVTKDASERWLGRVEAGSWGSARVSFDGGFGHENGSSMRVGGEFSRSDGHRAGTDHEAVLLHLGLLRPLGVGGLAGEFGLARKDFGAQDFYAPYPSFEKTRSYTSALKWKAGGDGDPEVEIGGSFRRHEDEFTLIRDDPGVYQNRHTSSQAGGDALIRGRPASDLVLVVGGEAFRDFLRSNSLGDREETRGAIFAEAVLGGERKGVLSVGFRQDWHQGFGGFLSPSLSGSVRLGSLLRARMAVGRSFRAPTWTERYYQDPVNVGREHLDPERAWSGEVGLDLSGGTGSRLSLTAFARRAEDLIDWARPSAELGGGGETPPPWETRNVEEATFKGFEVETSGRGPLGTRWTAGGMWLSVDSKEVTGFTSKYALRPLEQQVNLGLGKDFGGMATLGLNVQRAKRGGEDHYNQVDVRSGIRVRSAWVYLDFTNLLDERYPDITGAAAPGRALFLGIEMGPGRGGGR